MPTDCQFKAASFCKKGLNFIKSFSALRLVLFLFNNKKTVFNLSATAECSKTFVGNLSAAFDF